MSQAGGPLGHVCERLDQFLVFEGLQEIDLVLNTVASLVFVIDESREPIFRSASISQIPSGIREIDGRETVLLEGKPDMRGFAAVPPGHGNLPYHMSVSDNPYLLIAFSSFL